MNLSGLSQGPHEIANLSAGPAAAGWRYFGSASTGPVFVEPGTAEIILTFSYANLTEPAITVTFAPTNLPASTTWGLWFNGTQRSTNLGQVAFTVQPGYYERQYQVTSGGQGLIQYLIPDRLNFSYYGNNTTISLTYEINFALSVYGAPGGSVRPLGVSWKAPGTSVELYAEGSAQFYFKSWTGSGPDNYTGEAPQHNITIIGPVTEWAVFLPRTNYSGVVRFLEAGLPNGTIWTVTLGSVGYSSGLNVLVISGLIPCTTGLAGDPGLYQIAIPQVYTNLTTPGLSTRFYAVNPPSAICGNSLPIVLNFATQYLVLAHASPGGTVTATVNGSSAASTYVSPGTNVTFLARPQFGYTFAQWSGAGVGSVNGTSILIAVRVAGSIDEFGAFDADLDVLSGGGYPVTFALVGQNSVAATWSVSLDGQPYAANGSELVVPDVQNGSHSVTIATEYGPNGGSRSAPSTSSMSVIVGGPTVVNVSFTTWYWLDIQVVGPGKVTPGSGWYKSGTTVTLVATPDSGVSLLGWASTSSAGYSGTNGTTVLTMSGPIIQSATFVANAPPPDFWHRTTDLLAAAVVGFVAGLFSIALFLRWRRIRRPPSPPVGAVAIPVGTPVPAPTSPRPKMETMSAWATTLALLAVVVVLVGALPTLSFHPVAPLASPPVAASPSVVQLTHVGGNQGKQRDAYSPKGTTADHPSSPSPGAGGPTLEFSQASLPTGTPWNVSVWPFNSSELAPITAESITPRLFIPLPVYYVAIDFAIWDIPIPTLNNSAWVGSSSVSGPINPATTTNITVTFTVAAVSTQNFRFHIVETGLPSDVPWNISLQGKGYAASPPSTDLYVPGGLDFAIDADPIVEAPDAQYFPVGIAIEPLSLNSSWRNSTTGPVYRVANASFWVTVVYQAQYRVHVLGDYGGTVNPSTAWQEAGVPLTIVATPLHGYYFVNWTGNGTGSVNSTNATIVVTPGSGMDEIASFDAFEYNITVEETGIPAGETYSVVYNGAIYSSNATEFQLPAQIVGQVSISVPFVPAATTIGARFVPIDLVTPNFPSGPNGTYYVGGNGTIQITYATQYALTLTASGPGTIAPSPGSYWEPAGSFVAVQATPGNISLSLENWSGSGTGSYSGSLPGILIDMEAPITEAALFGPPLPGFGVMLTVVSSGLPAGTFWSAAVGSIGAGGDTASLVIGPLIAGPITLTSPTIPGTPGERFAPVGGGVYRFGLVEPGSFLISFVPQFALNISVEYGGSIQPFPDWVDANETVTVLVPPPLQGFTFVGWTGSANSSSALLTLTVDAPVHLDAVFSPVPNDEGSGPRDLQIASADVGIPAAVGIILGWLWLRRRT